MLIHKLSLLNEKDLLLVLGIGEKYSSNDMSLDLKNTQNWIENELFGSMLQLDEKSKNSLKHILGLILRNYDSLDYIA